MIEKKKLYIQFKKLYEIGIFHELLYHDEMYFLYSIIDFQLEI